MSTPFTALPASAMRIVRVICELAAVVAKVSGDTRPSTIAPFPVEAPRALAKQARKPGQFGVRVDHVARRRQDGVETGRADRQADQRNTVGGVHEVGLARPRSQDQRADTAAASRGAPKSNAASSFHRLRFRIVCSAGTANMRQIWRECVVWAGRPEPAKKSCRSRCQDLAAALRLDITSEPMVETVISIRPARLGDEGDIADGARRGVARSLSRRHSRP